MQIQLTVTPENTREIAALSTVIEALVRELNKTVSDEKPVVKAPKKVEPQADPEPDPVSDPEEEGQVEENNEDPMITLTIEAVGEVVQEKIQAGKRDQVKALLKKYSAKSVSTLKADDLPKFYEEVKTIPNE